MSVADRFWSKVSGGDYEQCWLWQASKDRYGYGDFYQSVRCRHIGAHRWAYEALIGAIPDGLHLDHLCRVVACVNPWHLEPVTNAENAKRRSAAFRAEHGGDHGAHGYRDGCRCDVCRAANATVGRYWRQKYIGQGCPDDTHGTPSGYSWWRCRCVPCKAAASEYQRARRSKAAAAVAS